MEKTHKYIAVDGPIGAGKTTLVSMLAKEMGAIPIMEPVTKNPFLPEFYKDRAMNAFKTQLFFLLNRYQQQLALKKDEYKGKMIVSDYTFAKDQIFAKVNLSKSEQALYDKIFDLLHGELPKPDLVIYLQASPDVLMKRIGARGIAYERAITEDYLTKLTEAYNEYFFNYKGAPLLVINSSDIDIVHNKSDWEELKKAVMAHKQGISHFHYVSKG